MPSRIPNPSTTTSAAAGDHHEEEEEESLLETLGIELTRIVSPVSLCMLLLVLLVSILPPSLPFTFPSDSSAPSDSNSSDSIWSTISTAALTSLIIVMAVTVVTFALVLLFYLRCTPCLRIYTAFSSAAVLFLLGGRILLLISLNFSIPMDPFTFVVLLLNFSIVGAIAVYVSEFPISVKQGYLVLIGVLVAYWFSFLPEWTTWAVLIAMAVYDLAAVLLPGGPLRLLVELAISRDEDIPALVYEARPVEARVGVRRGVWRTRRSSRLAENGSGRSLSTSVVVLDSGESSGARSVGDDERNLVAPLGILVSAENGNNESNIGTNLAVGNSGGNNDGRNLGTTVGMLILAENTDGSNVVTTAVEQNLGEDSSRCIVGSNFSDSGNGTVDGNIIEETRLDIAEEGSAGSSSLTAPLIHRQQMVRHMEEEDDFDGFGLGSSGAIKLGLGDFIFYSVLVGRAAMYNYMTVYACYLAIIAGLGITLVLLAVYRKALPALPVSIVLGVLFYVLTRIFLEAFVVQCSVNMLMF